MLIIWSYDNKTGCLEMTCTHNGWRSILTAGSFSIVTEITLLRFRSYARLLPHGVNLRQAEFLVFTKEETSGPNGQIVLIPVPQGLQVLVVDGGERIHAGDGRRSAHIMNVSQRGRSRTVCTFHNWAWRCFMEAWRTCDRNCVILTPLAQAVKAGHLQGDGNACHP